MIARGVRKPPALVIDGTVVCRGRVPAVAEILALPGRGARVGGGGVRLGRRRPPAQLAVQVRVGREEDEGVDEEDPGDGC